MIAGKVAVVCGYGDVGKGRAGAACAVRTSVVTEIDPICALQAAMEGYRVVTMEYAAEHADIFVTATGNYHVITHDHMAKMKTRPSSAHWPLRQRDRCRLRREIRVGEIKPQVDHIIFPDGKTHHLAGQGRLVNLGCAPATPAT